MTRVRLFVVFPLVILLSFIFVFLVLAASGTYSVGARIDCTTLANSLEVAPEGYQAACGGSPEKFETGIDDPTVVESPLDTAYANELVASQTLFTHTLNFLPGQSVISNTTNQYFGMDFDRAAARLWAYEATSGYFGEINLTNGDFITYFSVSLPNGELFTGLTIDPRTGAVYASGSNVISSTLYSINIGAQTLSPIGDISNGPAVIDIAMNCQGQLYGHDIVNDNILSIDPVTGQGTVIGLTGIDANFAQGMDFDNKTGTLYIYGYTSANSSVYGTVNLATGAVVPLFVDNPFGEYEGSVQNTCPAGTLTGQVSSLNTGAPLQGALVVAQSDSYVNGVNTDSSGLYTLTLPANSYTVTAQLPRYLPAEVSGVQILSGTTTVQNILLPRGELSVSVSMIESRVRPGEIVTNQILVTNTGTATLTYSIFDYVPGPITASGGPDDFGYTYADHNDAICTFNYIPITGTGSLVMTGDDVSSINSGIFSPINLGEPFAIYGQEFNSLVMASNGYLTTDLTDTGPDLSNDCPLPRTPSTPAGTKGARLYPLHDDLVSDGYYQYFAICPRPSDTGVSQGCSIFEWDAMHWPSSATWQQQAILYHATGETVYQIGPGNPEAGVSSTTGQQDFGPPTTGLTYACNAAASIPDNTAVCIYPPGVDAIWVTEQPMTGTLGIGESDLVNVVFDSTVIPGLGDFSAFMRFNGDFENDPDIIDLIMHVIYSMYIPHVPK